MRYFLISFTVIFLTSCSNPANEIKKKAFPECPEKTVNQVFKSNFKNHKWKSYKKNKIEYVKFDGIEIGKKQAQITFLFSENKAEMWSIESIYVDGVDMMSGFYALMLPALYEGICQR